MIKFVADLYRFIRSPTVVKQGDLFGFIMAVNESTVVVGSRNAT